MKNIYDEKVKKQRFTNLKVLRDDLKRKDNDTLKKVSKFCGRFDADEREVIEKILSDDLFAFFFIKDPKKQNIYEKTAVEFISGIKGISYIKNLPNNKKIFIVDGQISDTKKDTNVKSVDFEIIYRGKTFYAFHKFINVEGGAQDNQYNDVKTCMKNSIGNEVGIIFICDGPYFNRRNRMEYLKSIEDENTKACDISRLEKVLDGFFK